MQFPVNLIAIVLIFNTISLKSQIFQAADYRKDLSIKLEVIDEKRIEKGIKTLNEAFLVERQAIKMVEGLQENEKLDATSREYKKAIEKFIQASEKYREGHLIIYTVFQENCLKFGELMKKMQHTATGLNKAKFYERKGSRAFDKALSSRDLLAMLEKHDLIQYKMAEALELEKLAIRDRGRAIQIYQDFPVEYDYGWVDDVTPQEVEAAFKDPAISRPPADLFVQKPIKPDTSAILPAKAPVTFKVQIAAHTVRIDNKYIRENIYSGNIPVSETFEDNWYKYSIGEFDNFNDANHLLKQCRVAKAFVVAYQGGKRLSIKDALSQIRENQ
ncbi:MAG: hypothetical protein JXB34_12885 [Bacteroidales bacterium]|nr:hypothetical protein [Bacteroidales bacterium]